MSSFSIPLTGLEASSTALNTIANNLSNMNTTAFKSQDVTFSDLFYQQIGARGRAIRCRWARAPRSRRPRPTFLRAASR